MGRSGATGKVKRHSVHVAALQAQLARADAEVSRLEDEKVFMVARALSRVHNGPRCTGLSSDALAMYALTGDRSGWREPADPSDLMACARTYQMAPDHLRLIMRPILDQWTATVCCKWPQSEVELIDALNLLATGGVDAG